MEERGGREIGGWGLRSGRLGGGDRADGHLGEECAGGKLCVSVGEVLGAGRHRRVGGQARLRLTVVLLLFIIVVIVWAVRVITIGILAVGAAQLTPVSCRGKSGINPN